ncbi:hypothetical protein ACI2KR_07930 [Pseudomonas luteola]
MSSYDFIPRTPSQLGYVALAAYKKGFENEQKNQKPHEIQLEKNAKHLEVQNRRLNDHYISQQETNRSYVLQDRSAEDNGAMSIEAKSMATLGLSLLFDAAKDAALDFKDFLSIIEQDRLKKIDHTHARKSSAQETNCITENHSLKPRPTSYDSYGLDELIPRQDLSYAESHYEIPETPAQVAGIAHEIDTLSQHTTRAPAKTDQIYSPRPMGM